MEINKGVIAKLRAEYGDAFYLWIASNIRRTFWS